LTSIGDVYRQFSYTEITTRENYLIKSTEFENTTSLTFYIFQQSFQFYICYKIIK